MSLMNLKPDCIYQLTPILLVFLYLAHRDEFISTSNTVLGKFIAIALIMLYTTIDKYLGLFVCALIITYYYNGVLEGYVTLDKEQYPSQRPKGKDEEDAEDDDDEDEESIRGWNFPKWMTSFAGLSDVVQRNILEQDIQEGMCNKDHKDTFTQERTHQKDGKTCPLSISEKKLEAEKEVNKKCDECIYAQ
jgi:hypothetical protein